SVWIRNVRGLSERALFQTDGPFGLKESSAELQLCHSGGKSERHRHKFEFVHAIDRLRRQVEDWHGSTYPGRYLACILKIDIPTKLKIRVPARNIKKFYRRAISCKNNVTACFGEVDGTCIVAGELSVHQLEVAFDVGMLQRFRKRNVSTQNT